MPISLKDIARMANVSTATVSRVINDKALGNMKEETCAKVKRIIEETGHTRLPQYQPFCRQPIGMGPGPCSAHIVRRDNYLRASAIGFGNAHACADLIHRTR